MAEVKPIHSLLVAQKIDDSGCTITQLEENVYRISVSVPAAAFPPHGFSFGIFLLVDEHPLLFHVSMRSLFPAMKKAVESVLPLNKLRYISFSHHEADEDGSINEWLEACPNAQVVCSQLCANLHINDFLLKKKPVHHLEDGQELSLGKHKVRFVYTPHLPHGWETGYLFETTRNILFAGDITTQLGSDCSPLIEDIETLFSQFGGVYGVGANPNDPFEKEYMVFNDRTESNLRRLISFKPRLMLNMHGSCFRGDGAAVLERLLHKMKAIHLKNRDTQH